MWYTATTNTSPQTGTAVSTDAAATCVLKNEGSTVNTGTGGATGSLVLATGGNTITVTVTSGTETAIYTVEVTKTA